MLIPKKVRIGEHFYKVQKLMVGKNDGLVGRIHYGDKKLMVKHSIDKKCNESVFFHEIAHGILKELEYNYPKIVKLRNDELFVDEMGLLLRKTFLSLLKKQK